MIDKKKIKSFIFSIITYRNSVRKKHGQKEIEISYQISDDDFRVRLFYYHFKLVITFLRL